MAFTYGFFNSLKGDRKYNAEQVSEIFDGILKDGIIPSIGGLFAVTTANNGMQINVATGRAWFNHTWSKNDSVMVLTVPISDVTRPRYDTVVLEVNHEQGVRANTIKIISGSPAVNPTKPSLVNTERVHQYPLAHILVPAAAETITASDIENAVGLEPTVFATGVLESASLDDLWAQWEGDWTTWFDGIKLQLSGDIVTNLQLQIEECVKITQKATTDEATAGTDDSKWMTPLKTKEAIMENSRYVTLEGGAYTIEVCNNMMPPCSVWPAKYNDPKMYGVLKQYVVLNDNTIALCAERYVWNVSTSKQPIYGEVLPASVTAIHASIVNPFNASQMYSFANYDPMLIYRVTPTASNPVAGKVSLGQLAYITDYSIGYGGSHESISGLIIGSDWMARIMSSKASSSSPYPVKCGIAMLDLNTKIQTNIIDTTNFYSYSTGSGNYAPISVGGVYENGNIRLFACGRLNNQYGLFTSLFTVPERKFSSWSRLTAIGGNGSVSDSIGGAAVRVYSSQDKIYVHASIKPSSASGSVSYNSLYYYNSGIVNAINISSIPSTLHSMGDGRVYGEVSGTPNSYIIINGTSVKTITFPDYSGYENHSGFSTFLGTNLWATIPYYDIPILYDENGNNVRLLDAMASPSGKGNASLILYCPENQMLISKNTYSTPSSPYYYRDMYFVYKISNRKSILKGE